MTVGVTELPRRGHGHTDPVRRAGGVVTALDPYLARLDALDDALICAVAASKSEVIGWTGATIRLRRWEA